jgi:hypothetical protein
MVLQVTQVVNPLLNRGELGEGRKAGHCSEPSGDSHCPDVIVALHGTLRSEGLRPLPRAVSATCEGATRCAQPAPFPPG